MNELKDKKVILFGVSFALLDFLDYCSSDSKTFQLSNNLTVIETGGMKGRKEEMTKDGTSENSSRVVLKLKNIFGILDDRIVVSGIFFGRKCLPMPAMDADFGKKCRRSFKL